MCTVSAIYDYGRGIDNWNRESLEEFKQLLEAAKKFDIVSKQPDCEDPEKAKWLELAERQVKE